MKLLRWLGSVFPAMREPEPVPKVFPSDETMEVLLGNLQMRNNPMYQEDCAQAWFAGELKSLNITVEEFKEWYEKRESS